MYTKYLNVIIDVPVCLLGRRCLLIWNRSVYNLTLYITSLYAHLPQIKIYYEIIRST